METLVSIYVGGQGGGWRWIN